MARVITSTCEKVRILKPKNIRSGLCTNVIFCPSFDLVKSSENEIFVGFKFASYKLVNIVSS